MSKLVTLQQLRQGMLAVVDYIGNLFIATAEAIEELADTKQDKQAAVAVQIPADGWAEEATYPGYTFYYDIMDERITANDRVSITIAPGSMETAVACKLCPTNETLAGKIRVRSISVPASSIAAEYWIEQGKE